MLLYSPAAQGLYNGQDGLGIAPHIELTRIPSGPQQAKANASWSCLGSQAEE